MSIGVWQAVIILAIVLIIFGAGKLPHVMGDVAKGIKNFKSGMADEDGDKKDLEGSKSSGTATSSAKSEKAEVENKKG